MEEIDDWHHRISEGEIDGALQHEIADKILKLLEQKKNSMNASEKLEFAHAVTALSINVNSIDQPTEAGLSLCLSALQKVMDPEGGRGDSNAERNREGELIRYAELVATVERIKEQIV